MLQSESLKTCWDSFSPLGYLKAHSSSYLAPLELTQCSCLSPHINAFLSFLSPLDENQLVA